MLIIKHLYFIQPDMESLRLANFLIENGINVNHKVFN